MIWKIIYNFLLIQLGRIYYYEQIIFNEKVYTSYKLRQDTFKELVNIRKNCGPDKKIILIHSASVGEFEQARPVISLIKEKFGDDYAIVCTFYSPSGYYFAKKLNDPKISGIAMLPLDTYPRMHKFFKILKPSMIFFMRYDLWANMVWRAAKNNVKMYILNGTVRETSLRGSKMTQSFFRSFYKYIDKVFVISENDKNRYAKIVDENKIIITGDSRYDIVFEKAQTAKFDEKIFAVFANKKNNFRIFIAGSTYIDEDKILLDAVQKLKEKISNFKYIVVPHEIAPPRINELINFCKEHNLTYVCETDNPSEKDYLEKDVIIYNKIGALYKIYKLSDISFIGGSFHGSIHNIMEPAVYEKFIVFGPTYRNAYEAQLFLQNNAAECFINSEELVKIIEDYFLNENSKYKKYPKKAKEIVSQNLGCAKKIFENIFC